MTARRRLVVLRALGLGDLLAGVAALRALARAFPDHQRLLAAPAWQTPLARWTGAVDEVVDTAALQPLPSLLHHADVAVNLHGQGPQSTALLAATQPRRLIAFGTRAGPRWDPDAHERSRWCGLLRCHGIAADPDDFRLAVPNVALADRTRGATIIHPGAAAPSRRWPVDRWSAVARHERNRGHRIVITGAASERALALDLAAAADVPSSDVLAGRTSVMELVGVVGAAARLVSGDTGVAHVATAVGTPSVVLFGPTPPSQWGPPADGPHIALWHGGHGDPLGDALDPGLATITVDEVVDALERLHALTRQREEALAAIRRASRG